MIGSWRVLAVVALFWVGLRADVAQGDCNYSRYRWEYSAYEFPDPHLSQRCYVCGTSTECGGTNFPDCPTVAWLWADEYDCSDDSLTGDKQTIDGAFCTCSPTHQALMATKPADGDIHTLSYQCSSCDNGAGPGVCIANELDEPQHCDGRKCLPDTTGAIDPGCGDDEHTCTKSHGLDGYPINLSSGRVESQPITLYSLPTPEGLELEFTIKYDSHSRFTIARKQGGDSVPTVHHADEVTHSVGRNWLDSFGDRLMIKVFGLGDPNTPLASRVITWVSINGIVTFRPSGPNLWKSTSGRFELIDATSAGDPFDDSYGRWIIRSTDTSAPRRIWTFDEVPYTTYDNVSETVGRLRRRALSGSGTDVTGFYGYTLTWAANGTLANVTDTLGRQLVFQHASWPTSGCSVDCMFTLSGVSMRPTETASPVQVATLTQLDGGQVLDRIELPGLGSYRRFLYLVPLAGTCQNCNRLLTDVIVPIIPSSTSPQAPVGADEVVLEHHAFELDPDESRRPRAIESSGPGRHYAYQWDDVNGLATQFDLKQPRGACSPGCPVGEACRLGTCYVAQQVDWTPVRRLPERNHPFGTSSNVGSGNSSSIDILYDDNVTPDGTLGAPRRATQADGSRTTNGYDSLGRLRCIVHGDGDDEAFASPNSPDTSACSGPTGSQVVRVDYTTSSITKITPSLLGGSDVTEVQTLDRPGTSCSGFSNGTGYPCSTSTTGTTHDINGSSVTPTITSTRAYDAFGRVIETNGSLLDSAALDKTTIAYYSDDNTSLNFGRVQSVTRYVGTSASWTPLSTTTYSEYDGFGVPHRVTGPNNDYVLYSPSTDRLTWTITHKDAANNVIGTSTVQLNGDGTVRFMQDADNVCMTYEYHVPAGFPDAGTYVGVPTRIQRNAATCGATPIYVGAGEVETRTYVNADPDRLQSVERRNLGFVEFSYSGFAYDRDRRLATATTLDSGSPFEFTYTDVLPHSTIAPGAPAPGSWRTDTEADSFGRPTQLLRFIDATNKQTYTYTYATPFTPRPTQMSRGLNGAATSITYFKYDDFGRLVETTVPEAGAPGSAATTRYEYDVAGRMTKKRVGVGTALVRTSAYTYDSLGRATFVDHDTEHPVNCTGALDGTPIQDEEYRYDSCSGDVPSGFSCNNSLGRLTIARAIVQCSSSMVIKRGRWYDYDVAGRVARVGYSTVTGPTIGSVAISDKAYTSAGRLLSWTSPIVSVYGTRYTLDTSGRPATITTTSTSPSTIATGLSYRAFGPLKALSTESIQPVGGGSRRLTLATTYRSDNSIQMLNWTQVGSGGASSIALLKDEMSYGPAGLLTFRRDYADNQSTRYYEYDSLLRMKCEARGLGDGSVPTTADCATSSTRLAGLYTFGNGASATSPPDVRLTSFIKGAGTTGASYTSPSTETYIYASGSGQTQQITRTSGGNIVIGYDALGRRSFEYNSLSPTNSRRDYGYLPNGQLGSIIGYNQSNQAYTVAIRYDTDGRPDTIMYNTTPYTLFWDDADRLIVARIGSGIGAVTWNYHYLGSLLVSATRHVYNGVFNPPGVKRFWYATDERGLIYRILDEQGATYWQARWDATGWRQFVGTPVGNTWTPFARPGQILVEGTEAFTNGSTTTVRSVIALNRWRAYDPLMSAFLQPDPLDDSGRLEPEGYTYARSQLPAKFDASGLNTEWSGLEIPISFGNLICTKQETDKLNQAIAEAELKIAGCVQGLCAHPFGGEVIRQRWVNALHKMRFTCLGVANSWHLAVAVPWMDPDAVGSLVSPRGWEACAFGYERYEKGILYTEVSIDASAPRPIKDCPHDCLSQDVAHEALHTVLKHTFSSEFFGQAIPSKEKWSIDVGRFGLPKATRTSAFEPDASVGEAYEGLVRGLEEEAVKWGVRTCITCPQ